MRRFLLTIALCLAPIGIGATVVIPAEFREIVAGSEIIVHGRVVNIRAQWTDGRRRIESVVTIDVLTSFKGGELRSVEMKVPGGQIGRYRSVTIGAPGFRVGEEAVFFLSARGDGMPLVFGFNQGVFRIRPDARSGRVMVVPPVLLASGDSPEPVRRGSMLRRPMDLTAFDAQLRTVLSLQRGVR